MTGGMDSNGEQVSAAEKVRRRAHQTRGPASKKKGLWLASSSYFAERRILQGFHSRGKEAMQQDGRCQAKDRGKNWDPAESNEAELIARGLNGDPRALDTLFARHSRALYQTALRVLGSPEDAEEALQDGLLSAYRNLPRFERRSRFSTWLTRIVINAALMRRRSARARPTVSLDDSLPAWEPSMAERLTDEALNPEQLYAGTELLERIRRKLSEISPLLRAAFWLREIEGLSTAEAAQVLGISRDTLKARLWRARQELAARLGLALDDNLATAT
jgi:RNA polymerase sigma-70 factor, ECF subfamily